MGGPPLKILIPAKRRSNPQAPYSSVREGLPEAQSEPATERREVGLISWVVVGTIAGLLARRIVPGPDPGRFVVTVILGMAGASVGGFVVGILGGTGATGFNVWSIFVATLGAVLLLYVYGLVARRTA